LELMEAPESGRRLGEQPSGVWGNAEERVVAAAPRRWTTADDAAFETGLHLFGKDWQAVGQLVGACKVLPPTLRCHSPHVLQQP